jgi:polysaccharide export outer membrane protein
MKYSITALAALIVTIAIPGAGQGTVTPAAAGASSSSIAAASSDTPPGFQERSPRYRLRKGDSFDLEFALSPEFSQTVAVEPDGYVTLKGVGSIFVEGQTVPELTESVKTAYAKILHDPLVTVALKDFDKPYFIAAGQVAKPGKYDLRGPLTVTEAVAIAGGFSDSAKHSQVVLFRPASNGMFEAKLINVKKLLASRNLAEDIYLQPGDMLYVPKSAFSKIRPFIPTANMGAYVSPLVY